MKVLLLSVLAAVMFVLGMAMFCAGIDGMVEPRYALCRPKCAPHPVYIARDDGTCACDNRWTIK